MVSFKKCTVVVVLFLDFDLNLVSNLNLSQKYICSVTFQPFNCCSFSQTIWTNTFFCKVYLFILLSNKLNTALNGSYTERQIHGKETVNCFVMKDLKFTRPTC